MPSTQLKNNHKRGIFFSIIIVSFLFIGCNVNKFKTCYDEKSAKSEAIAMWLTEYGNDASNQGPFKAEENDGIWVIRGTSTQESGEGAVVARVQQNNCKVLEIYKEK